MKLTAIQRAQTGAFYTPQIWAEKAVAYMAQELGDLTRFTFYDPAAGEGALLQALPPTCEKFGSTLEWQDVEILRQKGIKAVQFDFLQEDSIYMLPYEILQPRRPLVLFTNPPFFKLRGDLRGCYAHKTYPVCALDSVALFLMRAYMELRPRFICTFSKVDLFQAPTFEAWRKYWAPTYKRGFMCPSESWPGLKGKWPVLFSIFSN